LTFDFFGQENHRIEDLEFVRDLFCLKLSQGCGGFRPCAFRLNYLNAMDNAMPLVPNSTCSKTKRITSGFFDFLSEWIDEGFFDRDKEKEKIRWRPQSESPISVDINALGVGVKKHQTAICDGVELLRAKVMDMRAVAFPNDDQRRVAYLSRRKDVFARQLPLGCPDS